MLRSPAPAHPTPPTAKVLLFQNTGGKSLCASFFEYLKCHHHVFIWAIKIFIWYATHTPLRQGQGARKCWVLLHSHIRVYYNLTVNQFNQICLFQTQKLSGFIQKCRRENWQAGEVPGNALLRNWSLILGLRVLGTQKRGRNRPKGQLRTQKGW